jgi:type II secretory pathway pseudopilin PulG
MRRRPSSARCSNRGARGFTFAEILVGLSIASVVIFGVGTGSVWITRAWVEHRARAEAQQSLRAAVEAISREEHTLGACMGFQPSALPNTPIIAPNFVPLSGTSGPPASITVTTNPYCAGPTTSTTPNSSGDTQINVGDTLGFQAGTWGFIAAGTGSPLPPGEYFYIQSVTAGAPGILTLNAGLTGSYPAGSQVVGADVRTLTVSSTCTGCNGIPTLTVQTLPIGSAPQPHVKGIDGLTVQYVLNRKYADAPTECNAQTGGTNSLCVVNLPTQSPSVAGDWQLVRALLFTIDARSTIPVRASGTADGYLHLSTTFEISPRNLIFPISQPRIQWTPY